MGDEQVIARIAVDVPYYIWPNIDYEYWEWWDERPVVVRTLVADQRYDEIELHWFLKPEMNTSLFGLPHEPVYWIATANYFSFTIDISTGIGEWSMGDDSPWTGAMRAAD